MIISLMFSTLFAASLPERNSLDGHAPFELHKVTLMDRAEMEEAKSLWVSTALENFHPRNQQDTDAVAVAFEAAKTAVKERFKIVDADMWKLGEFWAENFYQQSAQSGRN